MPSFIAALAASFVTILLTASALGHLLRFGRFRAVIQSHGTVPRALILPAALAVLVFELSVAAGCATILWSEDESPWQARFFALAAAGGFLFAAYIRVLLQHPEGVQSCGCTPLEGLLSPISLAPGLALMMAGAIGWMYSGELFMAEQALPKLLGSGWGLTLALLTMLLPASLGTPAQEY